jgi:DNA-binding response OmpR family regulator
MKILIADDDALTRRLVARTLQQLGHEVVAAKNGCDAWQAFRKETFPLIISDWMMPELNGLELCRMVRAENRSRYTYFILLTMLDGKGSFLEGMKAGADDFMTKPFDADQLAARLHVAQRIVGLQTEVKQLWELLPICSYCRKIRDECNEWQSLEDYVAHRTEASFSHGICASCFERHVKPQLDGLAEPSGTMLRNAVPGASLPSSAQEN